MNTTQGKLEIRWRQRHENFDRMFKLFRFSMEKFADSGEEIPEDTQELEGGLRRFEVAFALAWKTLRDKMEFDGITIPSPSPRKIFKLAFMHKYIDDAEAWIEMANDKSFLSHRYGVPGFREVLHRSLHQHLPALADLHEKLTLEMFEMTDSGISERRLDTPSVAALHERLSNEAGDLRDTGLSERHLDMLRRAFAGHMRRGKVLLYGSRAKGTHNDRSDIDLVVKGGDPQSFGVLESIKDDRIESDLPWLCDIAHLERINSRSLLDHIARVGVPLFEIGDPAEQESQAAGKD